MKGPPRRWKDSPDAPVGMRELLGSARKTRPLDPETFERGAVKFATLSAVPIAVGLGLWAKVAIAGVVLLAGAGAFVAVDAQRAEQPAPVAAQAPAANAPASVMPLVAEPNVEGEVAPLPVPPPPAMRIANPARVEPVVAPEAPEPAPSAAVWTPPSPPRAASTLGDELALLEKERAERERDPATALATLATHRALHPSGILVAERDLLELDALRRTGRIQDARIRAEDWLRRDPNGIHAARVRRLLERLPT